MPFTLPHSMQYNGGLIRSHLTPFGTRAGATGDVLALVGPNSEPIRNLISPLDVYQQGSADAFPLHLQSDLGQNLLDYSNAFTQTAHWTATGVAISAINEPGPHPIPWLTSSKLDIQRTADNGTTASSLLQPYSNIVAGLWFLFSLYAKAAEAKWLGMTASRTAPANSICWFNLVTGTVGSKQTGGQLAGIIPMGQGWYRCWVAVLPSTTSSATDGNGVLLFPAQADGQGLDGGVFPANGEGIYIAGSQLELPAGSPTTPGLYCQAYGAGYSGPQYEYSETDSGITITFERPTDTGAAAQAYWSGIARR